jgi:hypothetical protein
VDWVIPNLEIRNMAVPNQIGTRSKPISPWERGLSPNEIGLLYLEIRNTDQEVEG